MLGLKIVSDVVKAFRAGASPAQISGGLVLGACLGLTPGWPLHIIVLLLVTLLLNVNLGMATVGATAAVALGWLLDPVLESLGAWLLQDVHSLQGLWTTLYNNNLVMLTRFNNTVVMGAAALSILGAVPMYGLFYWLAKKYRDDVVAKINQWHLTRALKGSKLFSLFQRVSGVDV